MDPERCPSEGQLVKLRPRATPPLEKGAKRQVGQLRASIAALETEHAVYNTVVDREASCRKGGAPLVDVFEGMAGMANITEEAPNLGLRSLQPCDILYGWDLQSPVGIKRWKQTILEKRPLFVIGVAMYGVVYPK